MINNIEVKKMSFSEQLKEMRLSKRMSQRELAEVLGFHSTAIANYEAGRSEPSISNLIKLANKLNTSIDELVGKLEVEPVFNITKSFKQRNIIIEIINILKNLSEEDLEEALSYTKWRLNRAKKNPRIKKNYKSKEHQKYPIQKYH